MNAAPEDQLHSEVENPQIELKMATGRVGKWAKGFSRSIGPDNYAKLAPVVAQFHGVGGNVYGPFIVKRDPGVLLKILHWFGRLPPPSGPKGYSIIECSR